MKKFKSRTIAYRLLALLLVATTLWSCSIMASFATPDGTEENEPTCGSIAHSHTQEICYKETKTLICQMEADDTHTHGGTCYEYENKLVCEQPEGETHAHGEACYELQAAKLLCKIHVHGEDCYQVKNDLTCQLAEHIHTEECYSLCTCTPVDGVHQEGCTLYVPVEKCEHCGVELAEDAVHAEDCLTHCICGYVGEVHIEVCPLYVSVEECEYCGVLLVEEAIHAEDCFTRCTCDYIDEVHQEGCALYKESDLTQKVLFSGSVVVSGALPEAAELAVQALAEADLADFFKNENEKIVFAYDISLMLNEEEYQPEGEVTVTVKLPVGYQELCGVTRASELPDVLTLYHLHDGVVEPIFFIADDDTNTLTFFVDSFSVFAGALTLTEGETWGTVTIGDVVHTIKSTKTLVDANLALLRNEAMGTHEEAVPDVGISADFGVGNTFYGFDQVYVAVYELLLAKATRTLDDGAEIVTASISGTEIWKISGTVTVVGTQTLGASDRLIVVSEDDSACLVLTNAVSSFGLENATAVLSIQGQTNDTPISIKGNGETLTVFAINNLGGSLHLIYTEITLFTVDSGDTKAIIGFGSNKNRARYLYMSHSAMHNISGSASPGIFCRAYSTNNSNNKNSRLWLYDNDFYECVSTSTSGSTTGGSVIRSYAADNCNLRVELCRFTDNQAKVNSANASGGGAIYWKSAAGSAVFENCTFTNNKTNSVGGAIYNTGTMDINKCTFIGNYAKRGGGAIAVEPPRTSTHYSSIDTQNLSGSLTLDAETILQSNTTDAYGGGIYFYGIKGTNGTKSDGEDIEAYEMQLIVNGASIVSNQARDGGGVAMKLEHGSYQYKTGVKINAGSTITDNTATQNGGAIWMYAAECAVTNSDGVVMCGGEVSNNGATQYGGSVYMSSSASTIGDMKFQMTGGTMKDSSARDGGAVYMKDGLFELSDGLITTGTATQNGGAVYLGGGSVTVSGGTVSGGSAINGGGAYLGGGTMTVSGGSIQGNSATANGGGAYLNSGALIVSGGSIGAEGFANSAQNGGGAYLAGGDLTVSGGAIGFNNATNDGGGAYLDGGSLTISGGSITTNFAANDGGGAYISGGDFTLNGESALIARNTAQNGAGVYLTGGAPNLLQGSMKDNVASVNGGGIYIDKQLVTLTPTGTVTISGNKAEGDGAGIYIGGTHGTEDASFAVDSPAGGQVILTGNGSNTTDNGGAVCISNGEFTMNADNILITGNKAVNGGGVAVLSGNFSMSVGNIGESGAPNTATNGGGVFVNGGTVTVSGGTIQYNIATNGGGVGVNGGDFVMKNGAVHNNTATTNGGGVYVSGGDFQMEGGEIGGASAAEANIAKNGGGVYVADGNVTIINGAIDYNSASVNGGGMFVSSTTKTVNVIMLSGSLSNNTAAVNGGGMAVESTSSQLVTVEIGCLLDHEITSGTATLPIDYTDTYAIYAPHKHEACPVVQGNICSGIGGGFYLNSDSSTLKFYCIIESGNQAADGKKNCWGMDVEGGKVVIGDDHYHNSEVSKTDAHSIPYGHVQMGSPILVNGGQVDIFGDMDNPHFVQDITVNITQLGDHYIDHRCSDGTVNYKVHYVEDFLDPVTGIRSGEYIARQYSGDAAKSVTISSALFIHEGYEIKGWYTEPNGKGTPYIVGATYDLTKEDLPGMGETDTTCPTCIAAGVTKDKSLLKLYAYWAANGFDVAFNPNVPLGTNFGVKMPTQTFTYGSEVTLTKNTYVYPGHIFTGWNTMQNGSGTDYADQAVGGKITNKNGVTITLYAQWKECTHDSATPEASFIYSVDATGTILRRDCSCGGQTLHAILSAESVTYDKLAHPALITYPEGIEWPVTLAYLKDGTPFAENPVNAGTYTAFLTPAAAPASAMAQVTYTIAKADQQAPEKPVYVADIGESQSVLKIKPIDVSTVGTTRQYRVIYYSGGVLSDTGWQTSEVVDSEGYACRITVNQVLTNYYVEARYDGNDNYNPSPASRADQVFYYAGDVVIYLSCQDGISGYLVKNGDGTVYINLSLDTDQYYLLNGYEFVITADSADKVPTLDETNYLLSNIKSPSVINIAVSGAKRIPQVSSAVAEKQIFGTVVNDDSTVISRDSAFTAYYVVSHYDASVYTDLGLDFNGKSLPQGATVILQNKADASYWGYTASGGEQRVLLTAFTRMGSTGKFVVSGADLAYQFIVDFSRSAGGTANGWTVNLTADKTNDNAPVLSGQVNVTLVQHATFSVAEIVATAQPKEPTQLLELTYGASGGAASKWDGRDSALVLTPIANSVSVPRDIKASVTQGRNTTTYPMTANGTFVIPLSDLQAVMDVEIVLQSDLFPKEATAYEFKLEWIVSNSKADAAPLNGTTAAQINITFNKAADADPSLVIGGSDRSLPSDKTLNITVEYRNMTGYTIESEVLKKFDVVSDTGASVSQYSGIGKNIDIDRSGDLDGKNTHRLSVSLNGLEHGSYCVMVTVKSGILKVMEVPYYFIVQ